MDPQSLGSGRLVLVVDDHDDFREAMLHLLESLGFRVLLASNGMEALKQLEKNAVFLIITDLWMPLMDGLELMMKLQSGAMPVPPIIAVTGDVHVGTQSVGRAAAALGAKGFLMKPFTKEQLGVALAFAGLDQDTA